MRIGVASDDGVHIAAHTGRCREIVVFEIDGERALRIEARENGYTAHARGECKEGTDAVAHAQGIQAGSTSFAHHHRSHQDLISAISDCRVLITGGLGRRLVDDLTAHGIEAYVCHERQVENAATLFAQGRLPRVTGTGCGRHP